MNTSSHFIPSTAYHYQHLGKCKKQNDLILYLPENHTIAIIDCFSEASVPSIEAWMKEYLSNAALTHESTMPFINRRHVPVTHNHLLNVYFFLDRNLKNANASQEIQKWIGCSCITAVSYRHCLTLINVGTTWGCLIRNKTLQMLLYPQTLLTRQYPIPSSIPLNTSHHIPTQALGMPQNLEPHLQDVLIQENDIVLLATDGIPWSIILEHIQRNNILEIQNTTQKIQHIFEALEKLSTNDNASCSILCY